MIPNKDSQSIRGHQSSHSIDTIDPSHRTETSPVTPQSSWSPETSLVAYEYANEVVEDGVKLPETIQISARSQECQTV